MTPQSTNLAEAICHARLQNEPGHDCAFPPCETCKAIAETVRLFGAKVEVNDAHVHLPGGGL